MTLHGLVTATAVGVVAAITCALALAAGGSWPAALLTAGAAGGGTLGLLPRLTGRGTDDT